METEGLTLNQTVIIPRINEQNTHYLLSSPCCHFPSCCIWLEDTKRNRGVARFGFCHTTEQSGINLVNSLWLSLVLSSEGSKTWFCHHIHSFNSYFTSTYFVPDPTTGNVEKLDNTSLQFLLTAAKLTIWQRRHIKKPNVHHNKTWWSINLFLQDQPIFRMQSRLHRIQAGEYDVQMVTGTNLTNTWLFRVVNYLFRALPILPFLLLFSARLQSTYVISPSYITIPYTSCLTKFLCLSPWLESSMF